MVMSVPTELQGVWRRDFMLVDGTEDRTTRVYWAQTSRSFIDLRIPIDRPDCRLEDVPTLPAPQLASLAWQKGFAGWTDSEGALLIWHRTIDFRPPNGRADAGIVRVEGDTLYEQGDAQSVVGTDYSEQYSRIADGRGRRLAMTLTECQGRPFGNAVPMAAMVILIDGYFFFARSRSAELPTAETLEELIGPVAAEHPQQLQQIFDCEISMGKVAPQAPWLIDLSTHPWREREPVFGRPAVSLHGTELTTDWQGGTARWSIEDCNLTMQELEGLWR